MTAPGHPRTRFARAIKARNVFLAEATLGELGHVRLEDALHLVRLYAEAGDAKFEPAARRWLARWIVEEKPSLADVAAQACSFVELCPS